MGTRDDKQIEVPYNRDLRALEDALAAVRRPGDFYVRGVLETPMPRAEIEGVGVISFPIPDSQIKDMVKHAERAPYGRGSETILDTSVRNAWQLAPTKVRIGGKSWERPFQHILSTVTDRLRWNGRLGRIPQAAHLRRGRLFPSASRHVKDRRHVWHIDNRECYIRWRGPHLRSTTNGQYPGTHRSPSRNSRSGGFHFVP